MSSNFILIPGIAFGCYIFLLLAFIAAKKTTEVKAFIVVLCCCLLWTGGSVLMRLQMWPGMKLWYDISLLGLFLLTWALYRFLHFFIGSSPGTLGKVWFILIITMTTLNSITGWILAAPDPISYGNGEVGFIYSFHWPVLLFFIVCGGIIINILYIITKACMKNRILKRQMAPIILGIAIIFISQLLLLLPPLKGFPIDVVSAVIMVICFIYALYKRRLIRMTLLVSKGACYVASAILSALIFSNLIRPLERFANKNLTSLIKDDTLLIAITFTVFTVLLYYIMKQFIDKVFIKDEYIKANTLKEFSEKVSSTLRINDILEEILLIISDTMNVNKVYIFIENDDGTGYKIARSISPLDDRSLTLEKDNPLVQFLSNTNDCILFSDFQRVSAYKSMWEEEKNQLLQMEVQCVAPLKNEDSLIGVIAISGNDTKHKLSYNDIDLLSSISSIGSIAVKNSRLFEKAYQEARTDELTGLLNRKYFYETINEEYQKTKGRSLSLVIINVDDFKLYNQLYGATEGDIALKRIANIISASVGENGYTARYSNKEFGLILPDYDILSAKNLTENIQKQILNMNKTDYNYSLKALTVSCGISSIPYDASTDKELISNADMSVFQVKRNGKNGIMTYSGYHEKKENPDTISNHRQDVYSEYAPTIYALTAAIDTKDHYTFNHSNNVAYYSCELGYAYGLNEDSVEILREAALLHDIGKIGISENILNKPGKLTNEEFKIMEGHVKNSIGIIKHLPSLDYVIPAVLGHHEKYDGTGYPRRIGGDDIPLLSRILCIADSFDAMVSSRSYKEPYTVDYALSQITECSGSQFDPVLAELFVKLVQENKIQPQEAEESVLENQ